jgi:type VI protein secretion system component Hcp
MSAQAQARIERVKAERFGGGGRNDLPDNDLTDIDARAQAQELQFVHQRDVDAAVNILVEAKARGNPIPTGKIRYYRTDKRR